MFKKISGPALCGFADYFEPTPFVGAAPRATGQRKQTAHGPTGKPGLLKAPPKSKTVAQHSAVLKKAQSVLTATHATVKKAAQLTLAKPAAPTVRRSSARVVMGHGGQFVVVGATAAQSPKVKAAQKKLQAAQAKVKKLTDDATKKTKVAHASVTRLASQITHQKNIARKMTGHRPAAHPLAPSRAAHRVMGYVGADPSNPPDPNNPGFLMDGSLDPNYVSPSDEGATSSDPLADMTNLPPPPPMNTFIPDYTAVGGVLYQNQKGMPDGFCLSYWFASGTGGPNQKRATDHQVTIDTWGIDGTEHHGYVFGKFWDKAQPGGIAFGDDLKSGVWNHVHGRHILGSEGWWTEVPASEAYQSYAKNSPQGTPFGPLIGNPLMSDFVGMRVDGNGNMFWLPQEAPDWLTFPLKQAASLTAQATAKAQADAQAAAAAAAAKAAADAAAAQAAQDAQNALAESQAQSESRVQATQTASAQAAQDLEERKLAAQQAAADAELQRQQAQQALVERQAALQAAQQEDAAAAAQGGYGGSGGGYGGGGYGGGGFDDGSAAVDVGPDDSADFTPESDSDSEAADIDATYDGGADDTLIGVGPDLSILLRKQQLLEEGAVDGAGNLIDLDVYGNES